MKLVYIKWCDATSKLEPWMSEEEAIEWADNENWLVEIVGWLIKETKEYILISSKISNDPYEQYGQVFKIPTTWVRKRKNLKGL